MSCGAHIPSELVTFTAAELTVSTTASPARRLALRSPETSPLLGGQDPCGLTTKQTLPLDTGPSRWEANVPVATCRLAGWGEGTDLTELLVGGRITQTKTMPPAEEEPDRRKRRPGRQFWGIC